MIEYQSCFDVISGLLVGNSSGDIFSNLVIGDIFLEFFKHIVFLFYIVFGLRRKSYVR